MSALKGAAVAVVEDDPEYGELLRILLENAGCRVAVYPSAARFLSALKRGVPQAALVDLQLPGMSGGDLIRVVRADPDARGLLLVAMSASLKAPAQVVDTFSHGADEFLPKPVEGGLLLVRLEGLLRRRRPVAALLAPQVLHSGALELDPEARTCVAAGRAVILTRLEFDILAFFMSNPRRACTRGLLLKALWRDAETGRRRKVDKHVESLRRKLGAHGGAIRSVFKVGYVFEAD